MPNYEFTMEELVLALNCDYGDVLFLLIDQHVLEISQTLEFNEEDRDEFWWALIKSLKTGAFLEIKLWLAMKFLTHAT